MFAVRFEIDLLAKEEIGCRLFGPFTKRLAVLGAVDAVEPNTFGLIVMQDLMVSPSKTPTTCPLKSSAHPYGLKSPISIIGNIHVTAVGQP